MRKYVIKPVMQSAFLHEVICVFLQLWKMIVNLKFTIKNYPETTYFSYSPNQETDAICFKTITGSRMTFFEKFTVNMFL